MLEKIMKAYLYQQYQDDDNLAAIFSAYNSYAQEFYDWMLTANLPVFAGTYNTGDQLKWIAKGIYGQDFPLMGTSKTATYGPYNRIRFGQLAINRYRLVTQTEQVSTSDDIFKRIMTWNFYKGDGFHFTVPWLKRRVMRFLLGTDGTDIINDEHWSISVIFDGNGGIAISIFKTYMTLTKGALYNVPEYNTTQYNDAELTTSRNTAFKYAAIFKTAFENGLLHMPFWAKTSVTIIG